MVNFSPPREPTHLPPTSKNQHTPAHSRPQLPPAITSPVNHSLAATWPRPFSVYLPQKHRERRRSSAASNGFPGNANLPDLVQQSTSPLISPADALGAQVGGASVGLPHPSHPHQTYPRSCIPLTPSLPLPHLYTDPLPAPPSGATCRTCDLLPSLSCFPGSAPPRG